VTPRVNPILLTGGSGLLAVNWAAGAGPSAPVVLGLHNRPLTFEGVATRVIDIESIDGVLRAIDAIEPACMVHTAALTNVETCEADPGLAEWVNVRLAAHVAQACAVRQVPLVHISSDHLFRGTEALNDENVPVDPVNEYGRTKAEAEVCVLDAHPGAIVVRTNFYGWGTSYRRSFSDGILTSLRAGRPVTLFQDVFYTPTLIAPLVGAIEGLVSAGASGIFHVTGDDRVSKLDFGRILASVFGLDAGLIQPGRLSDVPTLVARPLDMSLSNGKVRDVLGRAMGNVRAHVEQLCAQELGGTAAQLGAL